MNKYAIAAPALTPQLFSFDGGAMGGTISLSAFEKDGSIWFNASDVCKALGISNSRDALSRLGDDEKGVAITDTLGGKQRINTVNESGLYGLIFRSRKESAQKFRRWITSQVIPAIRKHGGYINGMESLSKPEQHEAQKKIHKLSEWTHERCVEEKEARAEALRFLRRR